MSRFDKNIKDKLDGYSSPVSGDMWNRISSNLPQEQTDPKTWWLPMVSVTVVLIGAFALFLMSDFNMESSLEQAQNVQSSAMKEFSEKQIASSSNIVNDNDFEDERMNITASTNTIKANIGNDSERSEKNITNAKKAFSLNNDEGRNKNNNKKFQNQWTNESTNDSKSLVLGNNSTTLKANPIAPSIKMDENIAKEESASLYKQYNAIINKTRELKNNTITERSEEIFISPLRTEDMKVVSTEISNRYKLPKEKLICPSFNNLRFGVFAEAYYSNDFGMRALSYNGPVGDVDYLNIRNNTEQANYSFSAGARVSFMLPSGLGAKTGINYSQINETFKFEDPKSKQTKKVIIKEYQWENGVIVDSTEVTKEIDVPGKLTVINQNKYRIIDLPLLFTYEWGHKKRLYYSVTAGPMFNIKFTQQGKFLDPETLLPVDFSSDRGDYKAFTTNIGTSMYMSFALNYQLGNGLDVFVEPNIRYFLKNATVNTYLLNQKYTVLGLSLGLKYKL